MIYTGHAASVFSGGNGREGGETVPNYDFQKDAFHIFWSRGDELAYLDRESVRALSTILSAALNADQVEMPVSEIEEMLSQLEKMDIEFAKVELGKV